ncbi:MAG: FMN-binding protein [Spirochaetes bacterium]|jgi:electron transport complex protein RnfG|nr:FMN-binding protein [Spirochaetota bacterium]
MKEIGKSTTILAVVTLIASLLLASIYALTKDRIAFLESEKEKNALAVVLPGFTIVETRTKDDSSQYWVAEKKSKNGETIKGYAFISEASGYSGTIRCMIGVDHSLTILGISILQQTETPGLGARSVEIASKYTFWDVITGSAKDEGEQLPWFQKQFQQLSGSDPISIVKKGDWNQNMADELRETNSVSAITGATITTKAIVTCIEKGLNEYSAIINE